MTMIFHLRICIAHGTWHDEQQQLTPQCATKQRIHTKQFKCFIFVSRFFFLLSLLFSLPRQMLLIHCRFHFNRISKIECLHHFYYSILLVIIISWITSHAFFATEFSIKIQLVDKIGFVADINVNLVKKKNHLSIDRILYQAFYRE